MDKGYLNISKRTIFLLLGIHFLLRLSLLLFTNLGNDEVYYVQYALHPAISHFDHPPLVGFLIRLSTVNLHFIFNDFFVRLGPLIIGTVNLYLVYKIGLLLKDKNTGLIAVLLFAASFYASIVAGSFILPDTTLSLFWLLAIYSFFKSVTGEQKTGLWLILFGISVGLGLASKYQAGFLWIAAGIYFLFYQRRVFLTWRFWLAVLSSLLIFAPIIYWNLTSEYSGINYHADRIGNGSWMPSFDYFLPEFLGQVLYTNPLVFILILVALFRLLKLERLGLNKNLVFLLASSLPLIFIALFMSLYNRTLPHWSGPAYFSLIMVAAYYYSTIEFKRRARRFRAILYVGLILFYASIITAMLQINTGFLAMSSSQETERIGRNDFTADLGTWDEIAKELNSYIDQDIQKDEGNADPILLTHNWFPAGHIDYYYALPNDLKLYVLGDYKKKHEYLRINIKRGEVALNSTAYYITTSNYYAAPDPKLSSKFESMEGPEIIPVYRNNKIAVNLFIWKFSGLKEALPL